MINYLIHISYLGEMTLKKNTFRSNFRKELKKIDTLYVFRPLKKNNFLN